jgi:general secretion pathway protein B
MSFILEALKKSEQQRQQGDAPLQVRKRTLSMKTQRSGRQPYWILIVAVALVLCGTLWFYSTKGMPTGQTIASDPVVTPAASLSQSRVVDQGTNKEAEAAIRMQAVQPVEKSAVARSHLSAPVPDYASEPVIQEPKQSELVSVKAEKVTQPVVNVVIEQAEPQVATAEELPFYLDLSRGLREQMPRLSMSMHFYTDNPGRRLVRINDRLLHEGDWVSDDLQIVEITPSGANLDLLGKAFEMRSPSR